MYNFKNIIIGFGNTINNIFRVSFDVKDEWYEKLLKIYYNEEIKSKYIPELHQDNSFERENLKDLIYFNEIKKDCINIINNCEIIIIKFKKSFDDFYQILKVEEINITNNEDLFIVRTRELYKHLNQFNEEILFLRNKFNLEGYKILAFSNEIKNVEYNINNILKFKAKDWGLFLDKEPDYSTTADLFRYHNQVYYNLGELNMMLDDYRLNYNHKIIVGNAGTGKSHISAHLVKKIKSNGDLVIFLQSKSFNGDNLNFEDTILQLLKIPNGYTLTEILEKHNNFAKDNNKRCIIIIDALNETTKSNIGFSDIWRINLQNFINQINLYSNLYLVCTLRTSYIENIWDSKPKGLAEIKGFNRVDDIEGACEKYFKHYKIKPLNFETADLSSFEVPLLLDLYCKLTNENRSELIEVEIDINSYLKIFEDYINKLILEVKTKLNLQLSKPINDGFYTCSGKFFENNEAQLLTDDYSISFDTDPLVQTDKSIARAVLEGYLIFIKDFVDKPYEIVKHTQQEVGGYLLAKKLVQDFPNTDLLVNSPIFQNKIIGSNESQQHQLRLDILKFLIALKPDIIDYTNSLEVLDLSWWFLYNGFNPLKLPGFEEKIVLNPNNDKILNNILNTSSKNWFNIKSNLNFVFISRLLTSLDLWEYDLKWNYFIYQLGNDTSSFISETKDEIKEHKIDIQEAIIKAKFIAFVLSTNIRELRDKATICLIEFGKKYPIELLNLTIEFANFKDVYIYERLVSSCYGVALIKQNDKEYINNFLPTIARELYNLQFSENPKSSKYNYIVIDSIKHLLDFAFENGAIGFTESEHRKLNNYEFVPPFEWIPPTEEQQDLIDKSSEMSWPNPIGMDFGIYTIPRLIKREEIDNREAIANVYKRIFELGYVELDLKESPHGELKEFVWGHKIYGTQGKVDRLGKKYCWMAFFDYAGFLLLNKNLDVFEKNDSGIIYYNRLGDVDIDVSLPNINYDINLKLYHSNLLESRDSNPKWYDEIKIDSIKELFETNLEVDYTMLYGFVEQKIDTDYKVRSFLMVETFFIKKEQNFEKLKKESDYFEWDQGIHVSREHSRNSYFGELYWADTATVAEENNVGIPTGEIIKYKSKRTIHDILNDEIFNREDIGTEVDRISDVTLQFISEATLLDYLWESNSKILNGFGEYFPSIKMGKYLDLKADPTTGQILDNELNMAYKCISYEDNTYFKNTFNYMRTDLLKKYMIENNLALVYQVKQHSYDEDLLHNRKLKFFIVE